VTVSAPQLSVPSGTYGSAQSVVVTVDTAGAIIHYTTNGADPTEADPVVASGSSIGVAQTLTLNLRAYLAGAIPGPTTTARYVIGGTPATQLAA